MNVSKIKGFLNWQFQGILKNPSFYGLMISVLGAVAAFTDCPAPWPMAMNIGGFLIIVADLTYTWIKCSYNIYRLEQERVVQELGRKER